MQHNIDNKNNAMSDNLSKRSDKTELNEGTEENSKFDEKADYKQESEGFVEEIIKEEPSSEKGESVLKLSDTDEIVEKQGDETPKDLSDHKSNEQESGDEVVAGKEEDWEGVDENPKVGSEIEESDYSASYAKSVVNQLTELGYFRDFEKIENHKKVFIKWKSIITKLPEFLDTIAYKISETIIKPEFGIEKPASLLFFPCSNLFKEKVNSVLSIRDRLNDSKYLNDETSPNDLENIQGLNIRKPEDYDFILSNEKALSEQIKLFKNVLENILLALKTIHRQQKRLFDVLIHVNKANTMLTDIYSEYSSVIYESHKYISCADNEIDEVKVKDKVKVLYDKVYKGIRNYEDSYGYIEITPKLQKVFQENMSSGVFKAIDDLILTKDFFEGKYQPVSEGDDAESKHPDFSTLCEQLIDSLKKDLSEKLGIEMMSVKRGDKFNIEYHTPFTEPETDEELEDGLIKEVISNGFKMDDEILKNCEVIVVRNV